MWVSELTSGLIFSTLVQLCDNNISRCVLYLLPSFEWRKAAQGTPLDVGSQSVVTAPLEVQCNQVHSGCVVALKQVLSQLQ